MTFYNIGGFLKKTFYLYIFYFFKLDGLLKCIIVDKDASPTKNNK